MSKLLWFCDWFVKMMWGIIKVHQEILKSQLKKKYIEIRINHANKKNCMVRLTYCAMGINIKPYPLLWGEGWRGMRY